MNYIQAAIQGAGGPTKVAQELSVSVQAVCFWRDGKRSLPAEHCPVLERLNGGAIRCEQLRPDVDWAYVRNTAGKAISVPAHPAPTNPPAAQAAQQGVANA